MRLFIVTRSSSIGVTAGEVTVLVGWHEWMFKGEEVRPAVCVRGWKVGGHPLIKVEEKGV